MPDILILEHSNGFIEWSAAFVYEASQGQECTADKDQYFQLFMDIFDNLERPDSATLHQNINRFLCSLP